MAAQCYIQSKIYFFGYMDLYFWRLDLYLGAWTCTWMSGLVLGCLDLYFGVWAYIWRLCSYSFVQDNMCNCPTRRYPCSTRRHAFLSSCSARLHVLFLLNNNTCPLVGQEDMSPSCSASVHVFLLNNETCLLVEQEDMSS